MERKMRKILTVLGQDDPDLFPHIAFIMKERNIQIFGHAGMADNGREMLSLLVPEPEKAQLAIEKKQFLVREQNWVTAQVADQAGGLANLLHPIMNKNINIYSTFQYRKQKTSGLVMETSDPQRVLELLGGYAPGSN